MKQIIKRLLPLVLLVSASPNVFAQQPAVFGGSISPRGDAGFSLSFSASGTFGNEVPAIKESSSVGLEVSIAGAVGFLTAAALPSGCATIEESSVDFKITYSAGVTVNDDGVFVSGSSCDVNFSRDPAAAPFSGTIASASAFCLQGASRTPDCVAVPEILKPNAQGRPPQPLQYLLRQVVGGGAPADLQTAVSLPAGSSYALALTTSGSNMPLIGPIPALPDSNDGIRVRPLSLPQDVTEIKIGDTRCKLNENCGCPVPSGQTSCALNISDTQGQYRLRVSSSLVQLPQGAQPPEIVITRVGGGGGVGAPTISRPESQGVGVTVQPNVISVPLSAIVTNAAANNVTKLRLTSSSPDRGGIECGPIAGPDETFPGQQECTIGENGQVQFRVRSSGNEPWDVNASVTFTPPGSTTPSTVIFSPAPLYSISTSVVPEVVLRQGLSFPSMILEGTRAPSSDSLEFEIQTGLARTAPTNLTFTTANNAVVRWENAAASPPIALTSCGGEGGISCAQVRPVLVGVKAGTSSVSVSSTAASGATAINAFPPTEVTVVAVPTPSLNVPGSGELTVAPAGQVSQIVTADVSIQSAAPSDLNVELSLTDVSQGPRLSVGTAEFSSRQLCRIPKDQTKCQFRLSPGSLVGDFALNAAIGASPATPAKIRVRAAETTSSLGFVPAGGVVRVALGRQETLEVVLSSAATGNVSVQLTPSAVTEGVLPAALGLRGVPVALPVGSNQSCTIAANQTRCSFTVQPTIPGDFRILATSADRVSALMQINVQATGESNASLERLTPASPLRALPGAEFPRLAAEFKNVPNSTIVFFEIVGAAGAPIIEESGLCTVQNNRCTLPVIRAGNSTGSWTLQMLPNASVLRGPSADLVVSRTGLVGLGRGASNANRDVLEGVLRDAAAGDPVALGAVTPVADLCVRNDSEGVSGSGAAPLRVTCRALIDRAEATDVSQGRADVRAALRAINGEEVKGLSDASIAIQRQRQGLVSSRLQEVRRGGGRGFSADGLSIRQGDNSVSIGQALALGKSLAGMNDTAPAGGMMLQGLEGWGGFISGNWSREDRKDIGVDRGFDLDGYNVLLGVDREVISGLVLGFAFGAANSKLDYLDFDPVADRRGALTGSIDTDSRSFSAYASAAFANGMSLDGSLSYGRFSHRFDRIVDLSGLNRGVFTNRTDVDGSEWIGNLNLGYPVELKQIAEWTQYITVTKLVPTLGLVYGRVRVDGFTETENDRDNVWRLKVPDHSYSQLQAVLSVDMHNSWELIYRDSLLTVDAALQGYVDVLGGSGGDATQVLVDWATFDLSSAGRDRGSFISFKMDDRTQAYGTFELGVGWSLPGSLNLRLSSGTYFGLDQSSRYYINLGGGYTF